MSEQLTSLDQEELDYLTSSEYKFDYPGLIDAMNTPQFTIKDLGVNARDATYWSKKEILPELEGTTTTRRKYTLKQALWIKLIQQLRSFDISLRQIKKIKDHVLMKGFNVKEALQDEYMNLIVEQLAKEDGKLEEYKARMKDPSFLKELEKERIDIFEVMVLSTIVFRRDVSYIVSADGFCLPYVFDKHETITKNNPKFESAMKSPHIVLSLSQAYSQLIQEWSEKKWFNEVSIVSTDEKKILGLLRDKTIKELRIMKNNDEVDRVILIKDKSINAIEEFADHIVRNGYQTITISTRQGKPVHFKNEVSIKLKNIPE
ncbi:MAG: MerR family transcriptional regulator [Flavobacteriales bacterium]|jgi:DNA-binding transcriptional MerR regulator|nr:MerR family transcriptional regulator [Flavobacteriales bacterium]